MKIIGINGSPRKKWNTGTLINNALEGAESENAEVERINLYDLNYKGCISCFYCKRKDVEHGHCGVKDGLSPVLEKLRTVDAIVFGSPLYFMNISSGMAAFLERFLFSNMIYSNEIPTLLPKSIPSAFIYTMNITEEQMETVEGENALNAHQHFIYRTLGMKPQNLYAYNTYQFSDYEKYESSTFSEKNKAEYREKQFPIDCKKAFDMGVSIVKSI